MKFEKILTNFKAQIKQTFSNFQIFLTVKKNRHILLFLIGEQFIKMDQSIVSYTFKENRDVFYAEYFSPELRPFSSNLILVDDFDIANNWCRKIGENDSDTAEIIRNDELNEFIEYTSKYIGYTNLHHIYFFKAKL